MIQIFFLLITLTLSSTSKTCYGRLYYKANCNKNDIDYIGFTNEECENTRHGLESIGLTSNTQKYIHICGNQYVKYCVKVDENNNVLYTSASGYQPNVTCAENSYKFISNLCECNVELKSKCVNTQKFKLAECNVINGSNYLFISVLIMIILCLII